MDPGREIDLPSVSEANRMLQLSMVANPENLTPQEMQLQLTQGRFGLSFDLEHQQELASIRNLRRDQDRMREMIEARSSMQSPRGMGLSSLDLIGLEKSGTAPRGVGEAFLNALWAASSTAT